MHGDREGVLHKAMLMLDVARNSFRVTRQYLYQDWTTATNLLRQIYVCTDDRQTIPVRTSLSIGGYRSNKTSFVDPRSHDSVRTLNLL